MGVGRRTVRCHLTFRDEMDDGVDRIVESLGFIRGHSLRYQRDGARGGRSVRNKFGGTKSCTAVSLIITLHIF